MTAESLGSQESIDWHFALRNYIGVLKDVDIERNRYPTPFTADMIYLIGSHPITLSREALEGKREEISRILGELETFYRLNKGNLEGFEIEAAEDHMTRARDYIEKGDVLCTVKQTHLLERNVLLPLQNELRDFKKTPAASGTPEASA